MSQVLVPVILSGGTGTRLWPLSRKRHPKQFVALLDGRSPLQATAQRLRALEEAGPPIVVCGEAHRSTVAGQLRSAGVPPETVVLEPAARNTAPAIAAAAFEAIARSGAGRDPVLLVLPADHAIPDRGRFADAVRRAVEAAASGGLVAFGVVPTRVETGYGYITAGSPAGPAGAALPVERFVEKPDADTALACIKAGNCYWNSGMFVFGARQFLRDLHAHAPEIHRAVQAAHEAAAAGPGFLLLDAAAFARAPARSVDHAVMERAANAAIVPFEAGWSDIGSWASLSALSERDAAGNAIEGDAVVQDAQDCFIRSEGRMVAAVGVRDLVIVDTPDAVLVLNRHAAEDVKALVAQLERAGRDEHESPRAVQRPWGSYDPVHAGDGFKVKHVVVRPGGRLSLQSHRSRAEHWIVIRGVARVTRDGEVFSVAANGTVYVPQGAKHRLENPGTAPLELIEVQTGRYLGEDDIVRYEDDYGRAGTEDAAPPAGSPRPPGKTG